MHKIILIMVLAVVSSGAMAADFYYDKKTLSIYLDGEIRPGDAERVVSTAMEGFAYQMVVNSKGGDINEAMRIAAIVKDLHWDVLVAKGKICASSCFFVWLSGEFRFASSAKYKDGRLRPQAALENSMGILGIHRPYLKDPLENSEAPKKQEELMKNVKAFLVSDGVAQYLVDEMMSHPSNDIYWLNDRDIGTIGEYAPGIEETLIAKCNYQRIMKRAADDWSDEKSAQMDTCVKGALKAKVPLYRAYREKLQTGWRPWQKAAQWANAVNLKSFTFYSDYGTIIRADDSAKVKILLDYKAGKKLDDGAQDGRQYLSTIEQYEFDCKKEQMRAIDYVAYSEGMGKGKVVHSNNVPDDWSPIKGDIFTPLLKTVCGKS